MLEPLTTQQLDEIADSHPGDWYAGEWRSEYIDSTPDQLARYVVKHHETGTVLAELPDFAGPIALFVADAHEAVPALLAEVQHLRQRITELEGKQPARCGRTRDFRGSEHGPCVRQAEHWTAYCRDAKGSEFIAVAVDQPQPAAARPAATTDPTPA